MFAPPPNAAAAAATPAAASASIADTSLSAPGANVLAAGAVQCVIYVIQCEQGKYYVGRSTDNASCDVRFQHHVDGTGAGAQWTKRYRPISTVERIAADQYTEDSTVIRYMAKYGADNVRGGMYSTMELSVAQRDQIERSIRSANDKCHHCGADDHFINHCPNRMTNVASYHPNAASTQSAFAQPDRLPRRATHAESTPTAAAAAASPHTNPHSYSRRHTQRHESPRRDRRSSRSRSRERDRPRSRDRYVVEQRSFHRTASGRGGRMSEQREPTPERRPAAAAAAAAAAAPVVCYRCNRPGHTRPECYAQTIVPGRGNNKRGRRRR